MSFPSDYDLHPRTQDLQREAALARSGNGASGSRGRPFKVPRGTLLSLRRPMILLFAASALTLASDLGSLGADWNHASVMSEIVDVEEAELDGTLGARFTQEDLERLIDDESTALDWQRLAAGFGLVALTATIAALCWVTWRFSKNTARLGAYVPRRQGWAIAGWIVPVVSAWFPYQFWSAAWRAPDRTEGFPPLVLGWWLLFWAETVFTRLVVRRTFGSDDTASALRTTDFIAMAGGAVSIAVTLATVFVAIRIVQRMESAESDDLPPPPTFAIPPSAPA